MLVALLPVRVLLLSAKHLILAAKHAVACMSLPRGRFQRELSARQPGYGEEGAVETAASS